MDEMADTLVVKRLMRNLRYRYTYVKAFESFLQPEPHHEVAKLLKVLIGAQESAAVLLSGYLRSLGLGVPDLRPVKKLLDHASLRKGMRSRLLFICYGLNRAASWYREQLVDRQMTADPDLKRLLFDLGEREASALWRTQMVMARLGIHDKPAPEVLSRVARGGAVDTEYSRSGEIERSKRPVWDGVGRSSGRQRHDGKPGG
jgi:hypothetical protein